MRLLVTLFATVLALHAQVPRLVEVQERRLANGARLLVVERRGLPAFHAELVFRGGQAEEPTALAGATDLLARTLFGATWPEDLQPGKGPGHLDGLLRQEEGILEALRLERLHLHRDPAAPSQLPGLEASLASLQTRLRAQGSTRALEDVYLSQGGSQGAEARADALRTWTELPTAALDLWCRTEAQRLQTLQLSRFSFQRDQLAAELRARGPQGPALLLGAALPGHPYGRDLRDHLPTLEALRWSELRSYARRALSPGRLTIIIVGGQSLDQVAPLVERSLGALPLPQDAEEPLLPEIPSDLGDRRVQATQGTEPRLLVGWRIPPHSHPDHLALRLAAALLDGGGTGRLITHLVRQKGLARQVDLELDVPGGRLPGLLTVDLRPATGHSLPELEGALHTEILRLQQEPIPPDEWTKALALLGTEYVHTVDDPAALARALGLAWAEGGDWRLLGLEAQRLSTLAQETVQAAARAWLNPSHRTMARLEPSLTEAHDPLDQELVKVLGALAEARIPDLAQREHLVAEGLRQLRMLSPEERLRTLHLMEAQPAPVKR